MFARWNPGTMMQSGRARGVKKGRRLVCFPMEALEVRGLLCTMGVLHPIHPVDRPDRLRVLPVMSSVHDEPHPATTDTAANAEARSAHSTGTPTPTIAVRSGGLRRSVNDMIAARTMLESVSTPHAPIDPTTLEGLTEATAEGAGAGGTSGIDLAEIPTLGKDSTDPASIGGLGTAANRPSTSTPLISSVMKPAPDHTVARTTLHITAGETERLGEVRSRTGTNAEDLQTLAIVSDSMDQIPGETVIRVGLLDGEGQVNWEEIDRDLRQILDGLGLPGIRNASQTGLAWVPWVGAVAGAYLSHRATAGRRRPFWRAPARGLSPAPLPVGPWPLSSP